MPCKITFSFHFAVKSEVISNDKVNEDVEIKQEKTSPIKKPTQRKSRQSKSELDQSKDISDDENSKSQDLKNEKNKAVKSKKTRQQNKGKYNF